MAYGGSLNSPGPQGYAFLATGPTTLVSLAASTTTVTLSQFVTTAIYPTQVAIWNLGTAANVNTAANVAFGTNVTVSATAGVPIVPLVLMTPAASSNDTGLQILTTGKRPTNVLTIGTAGTTTLYITPGEGSR